MIRIRQLILRPTTGRLLVGWGLYLISAGVWATAGVAAEHGSAVASALRGLFNPGSASDSNTMGLLQRSNFIERVAGQGGRIEMAFVVDATESMEEQLQGIQQRLLSMMDDVRRVAGDEVYVQLVLYRDSGAASGVIELPLGKEAFSSDVPSIQAALQKLVPETGAPYFHEAVDQGLYVALNELPWSQTGQVKRWIILIGDAPPFDRGFREPESGAERKYSTEQLIQQAQQRGIEINAIICPTRATDQAVYDEVIGLTRFFCGEITSQTGGWMLDLSDPQLLETVTQAAQGAVSDFLAIEPITQAELDEMRAAAQHQQSAIAPQGRVRVAVMPHLNMEKMTFSRRDPGVRFADEMRSQLETVGLDVDVVSNYELERVYNRLELQGMGREAALQQIGMGVSADYVFWGAVVAGPPHKIQSGILDTQSGKFVVALPGGIETQLPIRAQMCSTVLDALAQASKQAGNPLQLARVERRFKTRLVANTEEVERLTLTARARIADAMQFQRGMGPSAQLWDEAQAELESALKLEPNNPIVNSLLANVYFAQFQILQASGDTVAGAAKRRLANQFAGEAKQNSNQVFESDRLEIEADFHFYRGNFQQAAASYRQLAEQGTTLAHIDRARWMLAGIYSGDWGIGTSAAELVDARQARAQIVQLLAFFPESPHTQLLEKHLLWDDVRGATLSAHLPRTQVEIPVQP